MAHATRIEELRRRVQLDPASIVFAALAEEYRRAGQFEDAIATCQAGLQRHPAYLSARVTLGRALLELGRYDEAREQLEHVLRAAPENLAAIRGLAEIHHRTGETPEIMDPGHGGVQAAPVGAGALGSDTPVAAPSGLASASDAVAEPPADERATVSEEPPAPVVSPTPIKVRLSTLTDSVPAEPVAPPAVEPVRAPAPVPLSPVRMAQPSDTAVPRRLHPDEAALPALEGMLAAIRRALKSFDSDRALRH